jgi:streptogramin lyase
MRTHRNLRILLAPLLAAAGLSLLLWGIASAGGITGQEAELNQTGEAYEVNRDAGGNLWISDDGADEVWQIHLPTGAYTVYRSLSNASDARMDGTGSVWWTDASFEPKLGRIAIQAGTVTTWTLPDAGLIWGLAFTEDGRIWTTDVGYGQLFSFAPGDENLCSYPLPAGGASDYLVARGSTVWLGDYWNARIVKLDPAAGEFSSWQLPVDAAPEGLAVSENGDLWWADNSRGELRRLEPGAAA